MNRECSTIEEYDVSTIFPESLKKSKLKKQKEQFISQLSIPKASRLAKLPEDLFYEQYRDLIYWLNHPSLKFDQSIGYNLLNKHFGVSDEKSIESLNQEKQTKI